jgi:hypothetical protein
MTWFNVPSTFIQTKNHLNYFLNIFVFFSTKVHYIHFHKYTPISHFIKWNEIVFFLISRLRLYYNTIRKIKLWKYFKSLKWNTFKHAHPWKVVQCDTPKGVIVVCFHPWIWYMCSQLSCCVACIVFIL